MAMNKQRRTSNISNIFSYDDTGNIVIKDYSQVVRYNWNGTLHAFLGGVSVSSIPAATTDTDKFLVSDGGVLKYRTGTELLSDLGVQPSGNYALASTTLTINGTTYDLSANRSWTIAAGVSGSGTINYISKWTSSSSLGNSIIDDDGTSASVNCTTGGGFNVKYNSAIKLVLTGGTTFGSIDIPVGLDFKIRPNSAEGITVFSTGNTFIGTTPTNSGYKLDIGGTIRASTTSTNNIGVFSGVEPNINILALGGSNSAALFLSPSAGFNGGIHNRTGGGIEFYTGATPSVSAIIKSTGAVVVNSTLGFNGVEDSIKSGKYTPILTNGTNVASSTVNTNTFKYVRVGSVVNVSGWLSLTATAANTLTELEISLPIASNITSNEDVSGVANTLSGGYGQIRENATNNTASMYIQPTSTSNLVWYMEFSYFII